MDIKSSDDRMIGCCFIKFSTATESKCTVVEMCPSLRKSERIKKIK